MLFYVEKLVKRQKVASSTIRVGWRRQAQGPLTVVLGASNSVAPALVNQRKAYNGFLW